MVKKKWFLELVTNHLIYVLIMNIVDLFDLTFSPSFQLLIRKVINNLVRYEFRQKQVVVINNNQPGNYVESNLSRKP